MVMIKNQESLYHLRLKNDVEAKINWGGIEPFFEKDHFRYHISIEAHFLPKNHSTYTDFNTEFEFWQQLDFNIDIKAMTRQERLIGLIGMLSAFKKRPMLLEYPNKHFGTSCYVGALVISEIIWSPK